MWRHRRAPDHQADFLFFLAALTSSRNEKSEWIFAVRIFSKGKNQVVVDGLWNIEKALCHQKFGNDKISKQHWQPRRVAQNAWNFDPWQWCIYYQSRYSFRSSINTVSHKCLLDMSLSWYHPLKQTSSHVPNSIVRGKHDRRNFVGDELKNCQNYSSLYYRLPFEKVMKMGLSSIQAELCVS